MKCERCGQEVEERFEKWVRNSDGVTIRYKGRQDERRELIPSGVESLQAFRAWDGKLPDGRDWPMSAKWYLFYDEESGVWSDSFIKHTGDFKRIYADYALMVREES